MRSYSNDKRNTVEKSCGELVMERLLCTSCRELNQIIPHHEKPVKRDVCSNCQRVATLWKEKAVCVCGTEDTMHNGLCPRCNIVESVENSKAIIESIAVIQKWQ